MLEEGRHFACRYCAADTWICKYIVTHQGRPVAMLLPVSVEAVEHAMIEAGREAAAASWQTYSELAARVRAAWPKGRTSGSVLDEIRR
jgi:hypothetical protein